MLVSVCAVKRCQFPVARTLEIIVRELAIRVLVQKGSSYSFVRASSKARPTRGAKKARVARQAKTV